MSLRTTLIPLACAALLSGCATTPYSKSAFTPSGIDPSAYGRKVEAFAVVVDASSSMDAVVDGRSKFHQAKDVVSNMNDTIPEVGYASSLVDFGAPEYFRRGDARVLYGPKTHSRSAFAAGADKLEDAMGTTPLERGLAVGGETLGNTSGQLAMIVVSDFANLDTASVMAALADLKSEFGTRLCIHTIKVGNSRANAEVMAALAAFNGCGSSVNASALQSGSAMQNYAIDVLLKGAAPAPTPAVRYEDTTISASALFDHDKSELKAAGRAELDELRAYVGTRGAEVLHVLVIGHTDSDGSEKYNMALSVRRAEAVRDYLVGKGMAASLIKVSGEGESKPVATNTTEAGKAQNRRVDIRVGIKQRAN